MRIDLETADLQPLIERVAAEVVAQLRHDESAIGGKLAYTEIEAAGLLSMQGYQLRDERRDGRITASVGRGGRILYSRDDLLGYLKNRKWKGKK